MKTFKQFNEEVLVEAKSIKPLNVTNEGGGKFRAEVVRTGDKYGRNNALTNEDPTLVEIYDDETGQFVSRYYVSTFLDIKGGLNLEGGEPKWFLDRKPVQEIQKWLKKSLTKDELKGLQDFDLKGVK